MAPTTVTAVPLRAAKPWYKILYLQVLIATLRSHAVSLPAQNE